jgi:hypothetical protein
MHHTILDSDFQTYTEWGLPNDWSLFGLDLADEGCAPPWPDVIQIDGVEYNHLRSSGWPGGRVVPPLPEGYTGRLGFRLHPLLNGVAYDVYYLSKEYVVERPSICDHRWDGLDFFEVLDALELFFSNRKRQEDV